VPQSRQPGSSDGVKVHLAERSEGNAGAARLCFAAVTRVKLGEAEALRALPATAPSAGSEPPRQISLKSSLTRVAEFDIWLVVRRA
jgi:hypothetical protein